MMSSMQHLAKSKLVGTLSITLWNFAKGESTIKELKLAK
jgi:hypothetical protein